MTISDMSQCVSKSQYLGLGLQQLLLSDKNINVIKLRLSLERNLSPRM